MRYQIAYIAIVLCANFVIFLKIFVLLCHSAFNEGFNKGT